MPSPADGERLLLAEVVREAADLLMGREYAAAHPAGLGRLAKIFDYAHRLPFHVHPPQAYASLVGAHSKDEAYHFLPTEPGAAPRVVPRSASRGSPSTTGHDVLLPYLEDWDSDLILRHSRAELQVPGEGFMIPSGVLHAPGTALTLELQEDSDVLSMFQALNAGTIISKDLLFKDVRPGDRAAEGERFPLRFVDWAENADPHFYERHHLSPRPTGQAVAEGVEEAWVYYGSPKFCGKRLTLQPGASVDSSSPASTRSSSGPAKESSPARTCAARTTASTSWSSPTRRPRGHTRCGARVPRPLVLFSLFGPDLHGDVRRRSARPGSSGS